MVCGKDHAHNWEKIQREDSVPGSESIVHSLWAKFRLLGPTHKKESNSTEKIRINSQSYTDLKMRIHN